MASGIEGRDPRLDCEHSFLKRRVQEEANAAVQASSIDSTLIHVILATAYASRLGDPLPSVPNCIDQAWADRHRLW